MRTLRLSLAVLLFLPLPAAPADPDLSAPALTRMGPRLLLRTAHRPIDDTPLRLITVWDTPPEDRPGPCIGRVCVEETGPRELTALLDDPRLLTADLPGRFYLRLDRAGPLIGAPQARQRFGLSGQGVLVAVIDTGLDWTHPDFNDDDGRTRVAWLLDQSLDTVGLYPELEAIGGGAVFAAADLQPGVNAGLDQIGHGTHVAGIAVGSDPLYTGVAPEARLVVVKSIDPDLAGFGEDRVLRALAFARRVSVDMGLPLVINLSIGNQIGAHDGTEPIEMALEELTRFRSPPCAVVVAAGNEGDLDIHARGAVRPDGPPLRFEVLLPRGDPQAEDRPARMVLDFWLDGDSRVDTTVISPSGLTSDQDGLDGRVDLAVLPPSPQNGLRRITVSLEGGPALASGTWTVEMRGRSSRIDGWIGEWELGGGSRPRFVSQVDPGELVGPPATARGVIAVGAMVSRTSWPGADDEEHNLSQVTAGQLAGFSARGPTRDGRLKPELVAPGQVVASSLSIEADPRSPVSMFYSGGSLRMMLPDGRHAVASGTSMASPFVAGLCALAFQQDPSLTGRDLHARMQVATAADEWTGRGLFEPGWGFGKLDALLLAEGLAGEWGEQADGSESLCGAAKDWLPAAPDHTVLISAVPRATDGRLLGPGQPVEILSENGVFAGGVLDHGNGLYTRPLTGTGQRGRYIELTCAAGDQPFDARPSVLLAASYEEAHAGGVTGGALSCATLHPDRGGSLIYLWLGIVWLARRRFRSMEP